MSTPETPDILKPFLELEDVADSEKVYMFIQLCNDKVLIQHFQKKTMMMQTEMDVADPVYSFAYSVLRLAKPHLFDDEGNLRHD